MKITLLKHTIIGLFFHSGDKGVPNGDDSLKLLNATLTTVLNISPLRKKTLRSRKALRRKYEQIGHNAVAVAVGEQKIARLDHDVSTDSKILNSVKQKFNLTQSSADKISLLTIAAAADYNADQIARFFDTSRYLATEAI